MPILRLLLPLAIVVGLVIFTVSNGTPVVPLKLLGTPTPPLPLAAWVLGAIAAGAGTTLAITTLAQVPAGASRPLRSRSYGERPPYRPANAQRLDDDDDDWQIEELGDDPSPRDSPPGMRSPAMGDRRVSQPIDDQIFDEEEYEDDRDRDEYIEEEQLESDRPRAERSLFRFPFGSPKEPVPSEVRPVWSDDLGQSRRQPTRRSPLEDWDAFSTPRQSWEDWQPQRGADEEESRNRGKRQVRDGEEPPVGSPAREARRQEFEPEPNERRNRGDETVLQDWGRGFPSDWQEYERRAAYDPDEDRDQNADAYQDDEEYVESDPVGDRSRDDEGDRYDDDEYEDAYDRYVPVDVVDGYAPGDSPREYPRDYPRESLRDYSRDYADEDYAPDDDFREDDQRDAEPRDVYPHNVYPRHGDSAEDYSREEVAASDYDRGYDREYEEPYETSAYETSAYETYEPPYADASGDVPYEPPYRESDADGDRATDIESEDGGTYVDYVRYNEDDDYYDDFEAYSSPDQKPSERRSRPSSDDIDGDTAQASSPNVSDNVSDSTDESSDESLLDLDDLENWDDFEESGSTTEPLSRDHSSDSQESESQSSKPQGSEPQASESQKSESPRRIVEVPQKPQTMTRQGTIYSYSYRNPEGSGVGQSESVFEAKAANDSLDEGSEAETPKTNLETDKGED
ncbi:MAG: hypothetical protein WBA57_23435 [Elainellaceae cyanobacterium]